MRHVGDAFVNVRTRPRGKIRVLLVDDSPLALEVIQRMIAREPGIEVCGTARDGAEALALITHLRPDVVCTDLYMPVMGGLELTRELMAAHPVPVLVVSVAVQREPAAVVFETLEAGAVDVVAKPRAGLVLPSSELANELVRKIKVAAGVVALRRHRRLAASPTSMQWPLPDLTSVRVPRIVGIAASTGGPQAIETILRKLPANFPLPLLCVQHIARGFISGLVDWLSRTSRIAVRIAEDGLAPQPATAYFARDGMHLEIDADGCLCCSTQSKDQPYRPSADLALASIARFYGGDSVGVVLTGMGRDGVLGLTEIARAGGVTIAQDESTSVVFGMPRAAIKAAAAKTVLQLEQIAPALITLTHGASAP